MTGTVLPIVYRKPFVRDPLPLLAHATGLALGGALVGALVGWLAVATVPAATALIALLAVSAAYTLHHLRYVRLPFPSIPRQVPVSWRGLNNLRFVVFSYGVGLGAGLLTHIKSGTFYALLAVLFVLSDPLLSMATMLVYGLARVSAMALFVARSTELGTAYRRHNRLIRSRASWERATALLLASVAFYSAVVLLAA